jgi:hypothetical protein
MPIETYSEPAIARWLALGVTSRTHPVLRDAFKCYLEPLGIEAAWLEAEPFSALESGFGDWWLRDANWNPARFDRNQPAADDFEFLLADLGRFRVEVGSQGAFSIRPETEETWAAVRHGIRAGQNAEAFIHIAAGLILVGDPDAKSFAAGDDDAFCALVRARLAEIPPEGAVEMAANKVGTMVCLNGHESPAAKAP